MSTSTLTQGGALVVEFDAVWSRVRPANPVRSARLFLGLLDFFGDLKFS